MDTMAMLQPTTSVPGNVPTSVPAEYSISFSGIDIQDDLMSLKKQPQAFVSHDEDYVLWSENLIVTHSMEKFVMTGGTKALKQELSDAFLSGLITDFVLTHGFMEEEPSTIEEKLVLQGDTPYVSFAGRLGNVTSLLYTGLSRVKFCSPGEDPGEDENAAGDEQQDEGGVVVAPLQKVHDQSSTNNTVTVANEEDNTNNTVTVANEGNNTTNVTDAGKKLCEVWYNELTWPLYVFTILLDEANQQDDNSTSNNRVYGKMLKMVDPIGFVRFDLLHSENATADATNIIEEHKQQIQKNKLISISIIIGLAILSLFLIFKAWTAKYRNYESL